MTPTLKDKLDMTVKPVIILIIQVVKMEQVILQCLDFHLVSPTTHTFLVRYLRAVGANERVDQLSHVSS